MNSGSDPGFSIPIQFCALVPWVTDTQVGDLDGILGSWLHLGQALVIEAIWGVNISLSLFQRNKMFL